MLTHCPHCRQALQLTTDQVAKLEQALARLEPGKTLAVKCPRCRGAITLDKPAPAAGSDTARPLGQLVSSPVSRPPRNRR